MDRNNSMPLSAWVEERLASLAPGDGWEPNSAAALVRLKQLQGSKSWLGRRWPWAIASAAAVCLALMVLPSPRVLAHRCLECSVAVWQSLAVPTSAQVDLKPESARRLAPDFTLRDAAGKDVTLSSLRGKVVLLNFWATWCHGCQLEIPGFVEFEKRYEDRGLVVVGVSLDSDGWKSVRPWLKEKKVNYPIVIGNDNLAKEYGLESLPLTVLIDRNGKIADSHSGVVNQSAGTEQKLVVLLAH
jgi:peroxiredoxin